MAAELCDQLIYMPALIGGRGGYQVVAKSGGVAPDEVKFMETYGVPLNADYQRFTEGRRLIQFPSGRFGAFLVKNIGVGYDGRVGAFYGEAILFDREQFARLGSDVGVFYPLFKGDKDARGELSRPRAEPREAKVDTGTIRGAIGNEAVLARAIAAYLEGRKVALLAPAGQDMAEFLRQFSLVLPPELRPVTYTSYAVEPEREPPAAISVVPAETASRLTLGSGWEVLDLRRGAQPRGDTVLALVGGSLARMVFNDDVKGLLDFQSKFGGFPKGTSQAQRLEAWFFETLLQTESSPARRAEAFVRLAQLAISPDRSKKYYEEAEASAANSQDQALVASCYEAGLVFASSSPASFRDQLESAFQALRKWPESIPAFVASAAPKVPARAQDFVTKTVSFAFENPSDQMLAFVGANEAFRNAWYDRAKTEGKGGDLRRMAQVMSSTGREAEAASLVSSYFRDPVSRSDFWKYVDAVTSFAGTGNEELHSSVAADFLEAAVDGISETFAVSYSEKPRSHRGFAVAEVVTVALVGAFALFGVLPLPVRMALPDLSNVVGATLVMVDTALLALAVVLAARELATWSRVELVVKVARGGHLSTTTEIERLRAALPSLVAISRGAYQKGTARERSRIRILNRKLRGLSRTLASYR